MILTDVSRIGKRTLDTTLGTVTLVNRTNNTTYKLSPEGLERWKKYMAFGNERQGGGGKDTFVRLSGMFPTKAGNLIGRIGVEAFNTIFEMMTEANKIGGSLNIIVMKSKKTGKPEMYGVVGQPYQKDQAQAAPAGPFGQPQAQPVQTVAVSQPFQAGPTAQPAQGSREVTFGQVDVPKDDFDSLLETFTK